MLEMVKRFIQEEDGQGMTEYGLILALVAIVVIGALTLMGEEINAIFETITNAMGEALGENTEPE